MKSNDIWMIYSTFPHREEALSAAARLLEKRLIACANIQAEVTSLYHWEGTINQETEAVLVAKTRGALVAQAVEAIRAMHSYQIPAIVAWPLAEGHAPFLDWVRAETVQAE